VPPAPTPPRLVLASGSPRRRELLASLVPDFTVVVPQVDEDPAGLHPPHVPLAHAAAKAAAVAASRPEALTLGADTVVLLAGEVLGKPRDADAALAMLLRLAGREHEVVTGVCLLAPARQLRCRFAVATRVRFRPFGAAVAAAHLAKAGLDKAGAYALQADDGALVAGISGSWSNVVGLPLEALATALQACGFGRSMTNLAPPPGASS
jgi:septum formation protein